MFSFIDFLLHKLEFEMSEIATEIFKIIGRMLGRYGWLSIPLILIVFATVWIFVHHAASPGEKIEVFWGLVNYSKQPSSNFGIKENSSEKKLRSTQAQDNYFPPELGEFMINIIRPDKNTLVPQFTSVEYSIEGQLPDGYNPILVVRDPLGQYWSWGSSSSNRHVNVQIGVAKDRGRDFEIGILVTNEDFPLNEPRMSLPQNIYYRSILVTRQ